MPNGDVTGPLSGFDSRTSVGMATLDGMPTLDTAGLGDGVAAFAGARTPGLTGAED